jgi:hypothetical protein
MAKIRGVEIKDIDYLRDQIKINFGSISVFSRETSLPYRRVLKALGQLEFTKEGFSEIEKAFKLSMKNRSNQDVPYRITEDERCKIRMCILGNYNSYTDFCKKHKDYDVVYLTNVIKGNLKLKSLKYANFIKLLKRRYKLDVEL